MAPNLLALDFITKLTGVSLNWGQWALAMFVPGFIMLMCIPFIGYMYERPSVKEIDNKKIAADGLAELGPMKASEKALSPSHYLQSQVGFFQHLVLKLMLQQWLS